MTQLQDLESKVETLETRVETLENILRLLAPEIQKLCDQTNTLIDQVNMREQQADKVEQADKAEQDGQSELSAYDDLPSDTYQRYKVLRKQNRQVQEDINVIAIALHFYHKQNITARTIVGSGLVSYSKAYGIASWDRQFVYDFVEVHEVKDIFDNAINMPELVKDYPALQTLIDLSSAKNDQPTE